MMKTYLVGGAVRDELLGLPIKDRDWLVVGATPEKLLAQGYHQVGKDFPVFLHPKTQEEYALARTEQKNGQGYTGFVCDFSPDISLEEDLLRRDLTINAIAKDENGVLHDPYGGRHDLENKLLRHISPAFAEDPLRVLRVARFAARFHHLGFSIAPETLKLMRKLTEEGEIAHLSAERIWKETERALTEQDPQIYFETLHKVGALAVLFPELNALFGVPNPKKYHPEIDSFLHSMLTLKQAVLLTEQVDLLPNLTKSAVRFSALCHDLGKALTAKDLLPHHHGHEQKDIHPVRQLCHRLKVPTVYQQLAELVCEFHSHVHKALELRAETIVKLFNRLDCWRKPERLQCLILASLADSHGRLGFENTDYPEGDYLWQCYETAKAISVQEVIQAGFQQKAISEELQKRRISALKTLQKSP